jgi:pimeloyl-ACP methyl ester carboxylesterase
MAAAVRSATVRANGLEFGLLEAGSGPLALCLHGFPDTAHTWRHLLPVLARAGFHAVAPFMRGYAPTAVPADGAYQLGALAADAVALHEALGGGGDAVLIGHDWGAEAAYGAAAHAPGRWRRLVTLGVPPAALDPVLFSDYEQLKRFFYLFLFRDPLGFADALVASDQMSFLDRLWQDWSPGYDAGEDLARVKESLRDPANLAAAIGYYRAVGAAGDSGGSAGAVGGPAGDAGRYAAEQQAVGRQAPQPTLYLHGAADGCIRVELARGAERLLAPSSRMAVIKDAGHFLHLQKPTEVNEHILAWISA